MQRSIHETKAIQKKDFFHAHSDALQCKHAENCRGAKIKQKAFSQKLRVSVILDIHMNIILKFLFALPWQHF